MTEDGPSTIQRRAILVLGMHRSGTSAATRLLSLHGATLPRRMLGPQPDNETGFWEPVVINAIHDEVLASAGLSWHDISEFPRSWFTSEVAPSFHARLLTALREDYGDAQLFVVKDPRLCRLVPLWRSVLDEYGAEPLFVLPVRNPLEVAASLGKREGHLESKSLLLWLRHFLTAERDTRGLKRSFVAYDRLLQDWHGVADKLARDLDLQWTCKSTTADDEVDKFLSPTLRHHYFDPGELYVRRDIVAWLKITFDWASRAANDEPTAPEELDEVHAALEAADTAFLPLLKAGEERSSILSRDVARLEADCSARQGTIQLLNAEIAARADQIVGLEGQAERREAEIGRLQSELAAQRDEIGHLHAEITVRDGDLIRRRHRIDRLESEVAARSADIAAIRSSLSWRLTRPVRAVSSRIKRLRAVISGVLLRNPT